MSAHSSALDYTSVSMPQHVFILWHYLFQLANHTGDSLQTPSVRGRTLLRGQSLARHILRLAAESTLGSFSNLTSPYFTTAVRLAHTLPFAQTLAFRGGWHCSVYTPHYFFPQELSLVPLVFEYFPASFLPRWVLGVAQATGNPQLCCPPNITHGSLVLLYRLHPAQAQSLPTVPLRSVGPLI